MWIRVVLIVIFFFSLNGVYSEENEEDTPMLVWEPIENAKSYQLQIRDSENKIILDQEISETKYILNLEPGKYEHRVGTYNKFNKISNYSEWVSFTIARILAPEITEPLKIIASKKEQTYLLKILGKHFTKKMKITLRDLNGLDLDFQIKKITTTELELEINHLNAKIGDYNLKLENPRNKILTIDGYYKLTEETEIADSKEPAKTEPSPSKSSEDKASEIPYPYWKAAARSALLPGWGQYYKEQNLKAFIFNILFLSSAAYLGSTINNFNSEKKDYNNLVTQNILYQQFLGQELFILYNFNTLESKYGSANSASNSVYQASIGLGIIYMLNILDALFWKIPPKQIENTKSKQLEIFYSWKGIPINNNFAQTQIELGIKYSF